jgi:hypothetical protein
VFEGHLVNVAIDPVAIIEIVCDKAIDYVEGREES